MVIEEVAAGQRVRGMAGDVRDIVRHPGPRNIQPELCSGAVRSAARSLFPSPFNPGSGREEVATRQRVRRTARDARDIGRHLGSRDIQPVLCSVAVRPAARSLFPSPFNPCSGRSWRKPRGGRAGRPSGTFRSADMSIEALMVRLSRRQCPAACFLRLVRPATRKKCQFGATLLVRCCCCWRRASSGTFRSADMRIEAYEESCAADSAVLRVFGVCCA